MFGSPDGSGSWPRVWHCAQAGHYKRTAGNKKPHLQVNADEAPDKKNIL